MYERYRETLRSAPLLWVEGQVQREGQVLSVLVYRAAALVPRRPDAARREGRFPNF